eukprot:CAMPEP_0185251182 /NCGR_PEP_ID=MMETSP1359-20130426/629_1 /TAXON_ID=552665 /ORGANISM="Bigelowiella longifila, Strain CCMP242" /LENGTH=132 /DNA_ID=CAMNT_0027832969 /DNA_START=190 /DNA_END=585 /DNA_ORIENTATION=-
MAFIARLICVAHTLQRFGTLSLVTIRAHAHRKRAPLTRPLMLPKAWTHVAENAIKSLSTLTISVQFQSFRETLTGEISNFGIEISSTGWKEEHFPKDFSHLITTFLLSKEDRGNAGALATRAYEGALVGADF